MNNYYFRHNIYYTKLYIKNIITPIANICINSKKRLNDKVYSNNSCLI